jgi:hypothetical protein
MAYKKGKDRRQRVLFPDCIDDCVEADAPLTLTVYFCKYMIISCINFVRPLHLHLCGQPEGHHIPLYVHRLI